MQRKVKLTIYLVTSNFEVKLEGVATDEKLQNFCQSIPLHRYLK